MDEAEALAKSGDFDKALDVIRLARDEGASFELDMEIGRRLEAYLEGREHQLIEGE